MWWRGVIREGYFGVLYEIGYSGKAFLIRPWIETLKEVRKATHGCQTDEPITEGKVLHSHGQVLRQQYGTQRKQGKDCHKKKKGSEIMELYHGVSGNPRQNCGSYSETKKELKSLWRVLSDD